jgi:hypothetical protein
MSPGTDPFKDFKDLIERPPNDGLLGALLLPEECVANECFFGAILFE